MRTVFQFRLEELTGEGLNADESRMIAFQYGLALTFTILTTVDVLMTHRALRTGDYV